jgi:3-hydroxyisobutyrate dehydrogenase-like beta-hydroxyacid dehydrogenase
MKTGFIGLGRMGSGMAVNLLNAHHEVTVYNRTREKTSPLVRAGAKAVSNIVDACRGDCVITMLANDEAVEDVCMRPGGVVASLAPQTCHVSCSTISVALSQRLADAHAKANQRFVAAPVFGRPDAAAEQRLFILAAGESSAVAAVMPLLDAMGQKTFAVSVKPHDANLLKLSGNFLIGCVMEALGEAMALIGKAGLDRETYLAMLTSTLFDAPVYKTYGGMIATDSFEPAGFAASLGLKDVRLVLSAADEMQVPMPFASLLRDRFLALLAHGGGDLDWSAIGRRAAEDAAIG